MAALRGLAVDGTEELGTVAVEGGVVELPRRRGRVARGGGAGRGLVDAGAVDEGKPVTFSLGVGA